MKKIRALADAESRRAQRAEPLPVDDQKLHPPLHRLRIERGEPLADGAQVCVAAAFEHQADRVAHLIEADAERAFRVGRAPPQGAREHAAEPLEIVAVLLFLGQDVEVQVGAVLEIFPECGDGFVFDLFDLFFALAAEQKTHNLTTQPNLSSSLPD